LNKPFDRSIDRAFGAHRNWSRVVSAAILTLGLVVVVGLNLLRRDRQVVHAADRVRVGDDSASVLAALGAPRVRCAPGRLEHMRDALPPGTPRTTGDEILGRLRQNTAQRWVWGRRASCVPASGQTEIGFTRGGLVYWAVAEHGDGPATLP
jgi:hypothetical protein